MQVKDRYVLDDFLRDTVKEFVFVMAVAVFFALAGFIIGSMRAAGVLGITDPPDRIRHQALEQDAVALKKRNVTKHETTFIRWAG